MIEQALRVVEDVSTEALEERRWTSLGSFSERHGSWEKGFRCPRANGGVQPILVLTLSTFVDGQASQRLLVEWSYGAEAGQSYVRRAGPSLEFDSSQMASAATADRVRVSALSAADLAEALGVPDLDQTHALHRGLPLRGDD